VRKVAWVSGLAAFGGLIVLSVAGVSSATAVLFTGVAIFGMIALGNIVGGRTTSNRPPHGSADAGPEHRPDPGPDDRRGTMER
jgi:hypothetical protein